jgi:hypothetical protein
MKYLLFIGIALAACSCHPAPQKTTPAKEDALLQRPDSPDNAPPNVEDVVAEFRDSVQREKTLDTTRYTNGDTLRLIIRMARVPADSFNLPKTYLEETDLESFRAWNMSSTVRFFVNGRLQEERQIRKEDFAGCTTDRAIRKYGVLMYPEVDSMNRNSFQINYSLAIPLTDKQASVTIRGKDGTINCTCDKDTDD